MRATARGIKIKRKNKTCAAVITLILLFNSTHLFSNSFKDAVALEQEGSIADAIEAYRALLENEDENYCEIVSRLMVLVSSLDEKRTLLETAIDVCKQPEALFIFYVILAEVEEVTGNLESAQNYYQSASLAIPEKKDFGSLLSSAVLLFELGNYRGAEAQATVIKETCRIDELVCGAEVLLSRVFLATDREDKSLQIAFSILKKETAKLLPAALLWVVELSNYLEKSELQNRAVERLLSEFPESPEVAMYEGDVGRIPSPSVFIGLRQTENAIAAEVTAIVPDSDDQKVSAKLLVQTGSYSVRENAEYALKDLEEEGFTAEIRERTVGDSVYYRVLIADVGSDQIDGVILELKEKGFEGFRVYE
jgi:tetratricopeptide (TPR) repeat protein